MSRVGVKALVVAALLTLLMGGCGSDTSDTSSTEAPLTRAQFVKQANQLCEDANRRQLAAGGLTIKQASWKALSPEDQTAKLVAVSVPFMQRQAEQLGELEVPPADEAKVDAIVVGLEEASKRLIENPATLETAFTKVNDLAKAYGIRACEGP